MSVQHQKFAAKALTIEVAIIALVIVPVAGYAAFNFAVTPQSGLADDVGLVGHWTFDGSTMVTNVGDSSGRGNVGQLSGFTSTTTVPGKIGQALSFDGSDDIVIIPDNDLFDLSAGEDITVSVWVLGVNVELSDAIIGKSVALGSWWIRWDNNGAFGGVEGCSGNVCATSNSPINDGRWHHLVYVMRDVADTGTLYVDGVAQADVSSIGPLNDSEPVTIGDRCSTCSEKMAGSVDDVRIYTRALSAREVARLYEVGNTAKVAVSPKSGLASPTQADGTSSGLVGWWTFDGSNLLQNATDSSGQGKNGNLINFTSTTTVAGRIGQALTFNGSNNQVIAPQTATDAPMTLCAWFKSASATARQTILSVTPATANDQALRLEIRGDAAGDPVEATTNQNATVASADTTTGYTVNKWHHGCAVFHSSTDRRAYIDGGSVGTNTTSATPTGVNETTIGIRGGTSDDRLFSGAIDDARVYNRALSADEVLRLYQVGSTAKIGAATESGLGSATKADGSSNGLVGWWTFDGANLLQNATDSSGSGSNGQLLSFTSTTTIMGKLGQALNFDGTDDYIQTPVDLKAATAFTLSAWFKADLTDFAHFLFWQGVNSGNGWGLADEMHLTIGSLADGSATTIGNELSFTYMDSGGSNPAASDLNARIAFTETNKFHHVAAVVSGLATSPNVDLWLDGVLVASDTGTATLSGASWDTNLRIGRPGLSTRIFDGTLDDMRVYNRALSATEVKRLYQLGL